MTKYTGLQITQSIEISLNEIEARAERCDYKP